MSIFNLDRVFAPKSVAVIGATEREGSVGRTVLQNLQQAKFPGTIYPVNPRRSTVLGLRSVPAVQDIADGIDLAVITIPIAQAPEAIEQCAAVNCAGAVILSSGGKELGHKGLEIESKIRCAAANGGVRIIGPNCLGIVNTTARLNTTFANQTPLSGKLAFISQSGAICTTIMDMARRNSIGFSYIASLGSMLDVDIGDMIDFLGTRSYVSSIVMYVESLSNFRKFMSAARSVARVKPIVVLKSGRSEAGARAARSHTGAMTGVDAVYDAAFERVGIVRVKTFEELFDCAELLAKQPRPPSPRLAIVTNAGGLGVIAIDALADYGLEPAQLYPETIDKLNQVLPEHWSRSNPVDILGDASPERYRRTAEVLMHAEEVKGLLCIHVPQAISKPLHVAEELVDVFAGTKFPVFTAWIGGEESVQARRVFHNANIPTFDTAERAVRAFMDLYRYDQNLEAIQEVPPKLPRKLDVDPKKAEEIIRTGCESRTPYLTELEAKHLLAAYGLPVNTTRLAQSSSEAVHLAREIGYPVVLKIQSKDILHKSEAKGVQLNLRNDAEVVEGYKDILASAAHYNPRACIEGVTVQRMLPKPDYEIILGARKDQDFGPIIIFGMGGIFTEIYQDRSIGLPPLNRLLAKKMMKQTRLYRLLQGYRSIPAANSLALEEAMIRLAHLVSDFAYIEELDINPLICMGQEIIALDARVVLNPEPAVPTPFHLVISAYPNQYESYATTKNGLDIFIRPIKPEDAPLLTDFFKTLSQQTVYFRFFRPLKQLPKDMLVRFTQIDYDREIALVALHESEGGEEMLGAARVIKEHHANSGEFAVLVSDSWQGQGIGAALLKTCLTIAQERGLQRVWGCVLSGNTQMRALGKKLGFDIKRDQGTTDYILSIDLQHVDLVGEKATPQAQPSHVSDLRT
ncbi:bifunctional acetate--CoA ligase family protein/GNAT family N-acetyltransferase [Desulfovermiculus halophilus]|uniref:bifunctional acetate--CoA ligase family protein/GNAT family N-acetyltransferase n=1 Tax=Desulfovermiculus halophilus TaxID=339722 RepID=UPI00068738A1|nr:bifunctional acetate--CoA ligase family protein/GNAT family N-acetyltransferase [Desulfovermiculus halophilus]